MANNQISGTRLPFSASAPTVNAGSAAVGTDTNAARADHNHGDSTTLKSASTSVNVSSAAAPTAGQVLTASSGTAATWKSPGTSPAIVTLTDAATIATDASLGNVFMVTLGGNRTLGAPTNPSDGQKCLWRFRQDGTGTRTLALNAVFRFGTDITSITLTTTINKTDYMGAVYNLADTKWDVVSFVKGF